MDGRAVTPTEDGDARAGGSEPAAAPDRPCRVALLGPLRVEPSLTAEHLGQPKQRDLFVVLALHAGEVVSHDVLVDALWSEAAPRTATHSLQLYVSALRRLLVAAGSGLEIQTRRQGYLLAIDPDEVDVVRFRRLVRSGTAELGRGRWDHAAELLEEALGLWRGPALQDVGIQEYARTAVAEVGTVRLDALESLAQARLELGDPAGAMQAAAEVVAVDALRERAHEILMLALYRSGRTAEALRTYDEVRRHLDDELGALPSARLRDLHARILRHDESLLVPAPVPATGSSAVGPRALTGPGAPAGGALDGSGPARAEEVTDDAPGRRRRRRLAMGTATVAGVAVVAAGLVGGGAPWARGPVSPRTAFLVHHPPGEVNLMVEDGFDRAVTDFGLVAKEIVIDEPNAAIAIDQQVVAGAIVLDFTVGTDLAQVAARHPSTSFVAMDEPTDAEAANLATIRFAGNEGAYLAGFAAARTSATGTVGFLGGVDYATIWPFEAGFEAGARAADPDIEVLTRYLAEPPAYGEGFQDPAAGERVTGELFAAGADVVFAAAGTSGLGAFEAATQTASAGRRLWVIGVDSDQYESVATLPGTVDVAGWRRHILTSVVLRHDMAAYSAVASFARDDFRPGLQRFDLANGGVELSFSGGYLDALRTELEAVRASIADGTTPVPCHPDRLPGGTSVDC